MLENTRCRCGNHRKDNKILLAQRPMHADQPGLWELAGERSWRNSLKR
ncbi:hypothetical protein KIF59_00235 [Enterobacter cloacae subsp. cloacae]|nr:hypothetical protein [Enterobacter cloacae subsp. cloacae]